MALKQLVGQVPSLELVAECNDATEALSYLNNTQVELLLLDIEMPDMSGLELTQKLGNRRPLIIFTTAKKDYAVEAFELSVVDYLIKPIALPRLKQAIDKANETLESDKQEVKVEEQGFVFVKDY